MESTLHDDEMKEFIKKRFYGRTTELEELKRVILHGTASLKSKSKNYSRKSKMSKIAS